MAHQAGYDNVVASLGTALTPQQVALITRYAKRIALAYDVDAAGEKAGTFGATALEELIRQLGRDDSGVKLDDVRIVRLPEGKDPDEVLRDEPDRWREEIRTAKPIVDHLIDVHARANDLRTPGGKTRFVDEVLTVLRGLPDPVMRDAYLGLVHQVSGVEERTLLEAMHRPAREPERRDRLDRFSAEAVTHAADALPVNDILRAVSPTEQALLRLVLLVPGVARRGPRRAGTRPPPVAGRPRAVPRGRPRPGPRRARRAAAVLAVRDPRRPRRGEPGPRPGPRLAARARTRASSTATRWPTRSSA